MESATERARVQKRVRTVPSQWRETTIVPIYKEKRDPSDPANYRPITLLSQVRKIFEAAISKMIRREYKFSAAQMRFQPKRDGKSHPTIYGSNQERQESKGSTNLKAAYEQGS